jgi:hypothetical protein
MIGSSLSSFGATCHQGRILEGFRLHLERGNLQLEGFDIQIFGYWSSLLIQPLEASFVSTENFVVAHIY